MHTPIRSDKLRGRLNLESVGRCVWSRRLHWFGHTRRVGRSFWVIISRCGTVGVSGSVGGGGARGSLGGGGRDGFGGKKS